MWIFVSFFQVLVENRKQSVMICVFPRLSIIPVEELRSYISGMPVLVSTRWPQRNGVCVWVCVCVPQGKDVQKHGASQAVQVNDGVVYCGSFGPRLSSRGQGFMTILRSSGMGPTLSVQLPPKVKWSHSDPKINFVWIFLDLSAPGSFFSTTLFTLVRDRKLLRRLSFQLPSPFLQNCIHQS